MIKVKKILALLLVVVAMLSFTACHKKNEIAVKIGDVEFTSAYYMCALINANFEAQSKVNETLSDKEKSGEKEVDIYSKKIDGKKYSDWVKDRAIELLKEKAAYQMLCKENKVDLLEDIANNATAYASYYWSSYGESQYYEPNGVSQATYTEFLKDTAYYESHFDFVYGKEGEKAIADETLKTEMYKNFMIANVLDASFTSDMTDADKTALKDKIMGYEADLKAGNKTFEQVYKEYNNVQDTEETQTESTDTPAPKDKYATIIGKEGTTYAFDHFETVEKMQIGEVLVIELEENAGYMLVIKQDIAADEYYLDTLDGTTRHLIADEEYNKFITDYAKKLEIKINKYAIGQFKVEKIVQPSGY